MSDSDVKQGGRNANEARRSGRGLAAFAVLLALAAAGLAGYPYYQKFMGAPSEPAFDALQRAQEAELATLKRALDDGLTAMNARLQQQQDTLTTQLDEQNARIESAASEIADSAADAASTARAVHLADALGAAEVAFLVAAAQRRLSIEHDGPAALALLVSAQRVLDQMSATTESGIRSQLAEAIAALRRDSGRDVDAIFVRLETLKENLPERLPTRGYAAPAVNDGTGEAANVWQLALSKFLSLFQIRRHGDDGTGTPLTLDQTAYLRLNLELLLQTAEIALLRGDYAVYRQSLTTARSWLDEYGGDADVRVASARDEIDQLLALPMHPPWPDLSPMLDALRGAESAASTASAAPSADVPAATPAVATETETEPEAEAASAPAEPDDAAAGAAP